MSTETTPSSNFGNKGEMVCARLGVYRETTLEHVFFLYYFVRFVFSPEKILFLALNAFSDQYNNEIIEKDELKENSKISELYDIIRDLKIRLKSENKLLKPQKKHQNPTFRFVLKIIKGLLLTPYLTIIW